MMRRFLLLTLLLPLFCAGFGLGARAAQDSCGFTIKPMAFGSAVDIVTATGSSLKNTSAGYVTINCNNTNGLRASVCILIPSDVTDARVMKWQGPPPNSLTPTSAKNGNLQFEIYMSDPDAPGASVWPKGLADPSLITDFAPNQSKTIHFYGKILSGQNTVSAGSYKGSFPIKFRIFTYNASNDSTFSCRDKGYLGTTPPSPVEVTATISKTCTVKADNLVFPDQRIMTAEVRKESFVRVTCTMDVPYSIGLDDGSYPGGDTGRRMQNTKYPKGFISTNPADFISYDLYSSTGLRWGKTKEQGAVSGEGSGSEQAVTVVGKIPIPKSQPAPATYSDTITVTVTY